MDLAGEEGLAVEWQPVSGRVTNRYTDLTCHTCCRWRQSSSEVCILALHVPAGLPAAQLAVSLEAYYVRVANKLTGELYLEVGYH